MPEVLREDGFQVLIFTRDHAPAHVHVRKAGGSLKVGLEDSNLAVYDSYKMTRKDERKAFELVKANREMLLDEWRKIYG